MSFIDKNNFPDCDLIQFGQLEESQTAKIFSHLDKRCKTYNNLFNNQKISLQWYFPLTKEKYKFKCDLKIFTQDSQETNEKFDQSQEILNLIHPQYLQYWNTTLSKEEQKEFHGPSPDSIKDENQKFDELDKFNIPPVKQVSVNFALLEITPFQVEHTIYTPPQVVADQRKPQHESIFQPYKKNKKYIHNFDQSNQEWSIQTLNP